MRAMAIFVSAAVLAVPAVVSADSANKELQNLKGQVSYQHGVSTRPLATNASIVLADKDYAITGAESRGSVGLPDSSVVTVGSDTKIQLAFFNQTDIATAKFVLYNGTTRFEVRHPKGAKANYTFSTPTASIAVRGTQGDIGVTSDSLQVNVYEVCDPDAPVVVTTKSGQQFTVKADQAFVGKLVNGILQAQVEQLTQQLIDQFGTNLSDVPMSIDDVRNRAQAQVNDFANAATSNIPGGNVAADAIGGLFKKKPKATPTPAAAATCS